MGEAKKNKLLVRIYGKEYCLCGPESQTHLRRCADRVEQEIRAIVKAAPNLKPETVAVLVACNLADECIKLKAELDAAVKGNQSEENTECGPI